MRVLIVDDNAINRKLLRVTLASKGHDVVEASDGVDALRTLRSGGFDAVISDVLMPGMDGYRLCYEVRRSPELKQIPFIIFTSTYTSPSDEKLALSMGADRVLTRPAPAEAILAALEDAKNAAHPTLAPGPVPGELDVLKEYSEALVRTLEQKNEAMEVSEQRYRELVSLAPIGIYRATKDGRVESANAALARLLHYDSPEEVLRLDLRRDVYFDAADRERFIAEVGDRGTVSGFEARFKRKDGNPVWVRIDARAVPGRSGAAEYLEGFVHDIDERKLTEESLGKSELRFSLAFHESPIPTSISESDTERMVDVNEEFVRTFGFSKDEIVGKTSLELGLWVNPADRDRIKERMRKEGAARDEEIQLRARSGEIRVVVGSVVRIDVGSLPCFLSTFHDVTDRKRAEERYRLLFDTNPQSMWVFDEQTLAFLAVNEAACRHYGYSREEFLGMTIADIRHADDVPALRRPLETESAGRQESGVWRHRKKDGKLIEVEIKANPLVLDGRLAQLVLATDVTERRVLEQQLRQAQKMEAVGQLAGGIAHDFNNLLTVILGFTELAAAETEKGSPLSEPLNEIRKAGERAASLTRQLLAFSRRQVLDPKVLDLNALVTDHEKMLRRLIGEDVQLVTVLDPLVGRIRADAGQIEQVILNLAVNARDAMPRGGKLTIETLNVELDDSYAREHVAVKPGTYVMLAITDTGTGMSGETKSHVFEPFFTTKEKGKGTGLGLATVYGIVKQSGGNIWVYSEPNRGTTFKVYLPLVEGVPDEAGGRLPDARPTRGSETVLLVEDEEAVRKLTRTILERYGYSVLDVGGGEAALEMARRHGQAIHLLLTDVVMPEVSGPDLAARIVAVRPGVKVLFMSGYTDDAVVRHGILAEGVRFLQKPFTPEVLARKVRQVLDAPPAA